MSRDNFHDVGLFHNKFGLANCTDSPPGPRAWDQNLMEFRLAFMREELEDEFAKALDQRDIEGMFDALLDLVYVAMGTAHLLGLPWSQGWDAVQAANMKKIRAAPDGSDSKRGSGFDVVKPEGWEPPDIKKILEAFGWEF